MPRKPTNWFAKWLKFIPDYFEQDYLMEDYPLDIWKPKGGR